MKNIDNIEKLFKDSLGNLESDVNPALWEGIRAKLPSSSAASSAAGASASGSKLLIAVISAVAGTGLLAGGLWYFTSRPQPVQEKVSVTPATEIQNTSAPSVDHNQPVSSEPALSNAPAIEQAATGAPSPRNITTSSVPATASSVSPEDVQASDEVVLPEKSEPAVTARYGNAPKGDGGMMRYNRQETSSSGSSESTDNNDDRIAAPSARIFVNTTSGDAPLTVDFLYQGSEAAVSWDFNDGAFSRSNSPSHTFTKAGTYEVTLTARNSAGQSVEKVTIEVRQVSAIVFTPNVFTPNGDGENDEFHIETKNMAGVSVIVFNKKGQKVASWSTAEGSWNGKLPNGADAPAENYFYILRGVGTDGVSHSEKGEISLMR